MRITKSGYQISFVTADDLMDTPPPDPLIEGFVKEGEAVCLWGPPNQGKSFVAIDWALCIATGKPWLDIHEVKEGPVVYMAGEGGPSLQRRIRAWQEHHGIDAIQGAHFQLRPLPLRENEVMEAIQEELNSAAVAEYGEGDAGKLRTRLIVVDTLSQFFGSGDENTSDMAVFVGNLRRLSQAHETAVLIVHHSNRGGSIRGHSSLEGNVDVVYGCEGIFRNEKITGLTLQNNKMRDSARNEKLTLNLKPIGDEETGSLVIVPTFEKPKRDMPILSTTLKQVLESMLLVEDRSRERSHHSLIEDALNKTRATVLEHLGTLETMGLVKRSRGYSYLTPKGRMWLEEQGIVRPDGEDE